MHHLLRHALVKELSPIEWTDEADRPVLPPKVEEDRTGIITH